jgi:hypothetical protein
MDETDGAVGARISSFLGPVVALNLYDAGGMTPRPGERCLQLLLTRLEGELARSKLPFEGRVLATRVVHGRPKRTT